VTRVAVTTDGGATQIASYNSRAGAEQHAHRLRLAVSEHEFGLKERQIDARLLTIGCRLRSLRSLRSTRRAGERRGHQVQGGALNGFG